MTARLRRLRSESLKTAAIFAAMTAVLVVAAFGFITLLPLSLLFLIPAALLGGSVAITGAQAGRAFDSARLASRDLTATGEARL